MKPASKRVPCAFGRDGSVIAMTHIPIRLNFTMDLARRLDMEAGIELQLGHVGAAEALSRRAAELREAGR